MAEAAAVAAADFLASRRSGMANTDKKQVEGVPAGLNVLVSLVIETGHAEHLGEWDRREEKRSDTEAQRKLHMYTDTHAYIGIEIEGEMNINHLERVVRGTDVNLRGHLWDEKKHTDERMRIGTTVTVVTIITAQNKGTLREGEMTQDHWNGNEHAGTERR